MASKRFVKRESRVQRRECECERSPAARRGSTLDRRCHCKLSMLVRLTCWVRWTRWVRSFLFLAFFFCCPDALPWFSVHLQRPPSHRRATGDVSNVSPSGSSIVATRMACGWRLVTTRHNHLRGRQVIVFWKHWSHSFAKKSQLGFFICVCSYFVRSIKTWHMGGGRTTATRPGSRRGAKPSGGGWRRVAGTRRRGGGCAAGTRC